mgnify:CR=1 FL=1
MNINQIDKLNEAISLLKSINCPESILDALWVFSFIVRGDDTALKNWEAWSKGQLIEGELDGKSLSQSTPEIALCLPVSPPKNP